MNMRSNIKARFQKLNALRKSLHKDSSGVAAIEFAFIAPIMVILLMGVVDVSNAVSMNNRMSNLNRTLADLSSQVAQIDNRERDNIFRASTAVLASYTELTPKMMMASVVIDDTGVARVCWSDAANGAAALTKGQVITLPSSDLAIPNTSLMIATTDASYNTKIMNLNIALSAKTTYFRPRLGVRGGPLNIEQVERVGQPMC